MGVFEHAHFGPGGAPSRPRSCTDTTHQGLSHARAGGRIGAQVRARRRECTNRLTPLIIGNMGGNIIIIIMSVAKELLLTGEHCWSLEEHIGHTRGQTCWALPAMQYC
jgi:hypothetical protein